jgi:hypothetical protein
MPSVEEVQALVEDRLSRCVGPRAGAAGHRGDPATPVQVSHGSARRSRVLARGRVPADG